MYKLALFSTVKKYHAARKFCMSPKALKYCAIWVKNTAWDSNKNTKIQKLQNLKFVIIWYKFDTKFLFGMLKKYHGIWNCIEKFIKIAQYSKTAANKIYKNKVKYFNQNFFINNKKLTPNTVVGNLPIMTKYRCRVQKIAKKF